MGTIDNANVFLPDLWATHARFTPNKVRRRPRWHAEQPRSPTVRVEAIRPPAVSSTRWNSCYVALEALTALTDSRRLLARRLASFRHCLGLGLRLPVAVLMAPWHNAGVLPAQLLAACLRSGSDRLRQRPSHLVLLLLDAPAALPLSAVRGATCCTKLQHALRGCKPLHGVAAGCDCAGGSLTRAPTALPTRSTGARSLAALSLAAAACLR